MDEQRLYLDWNATAPVLPEVRDAMMDILNAVPGNASSVHQDGQRARAVVERARRSVAAAINAPSQAVILTGGATESNNQVLRDHVETTDDPYVICTAVEHPSVLEVVDKLDNQGVRTDVWPVDEQGRLDMDWLDDRLDDGATLISVMWANNEMGNIYDIEEIAGRLSDTRALLHVDATQALGRVDVDFSGAGVDYLTLSFHKMGGPKGGGATVVREGLKVGALYNGGHQERGRRPGTENVPVIAGIDAAARAVSERRSRWTDQLKQKKSAFVQTLREEADDIELRGDPSNQLPNTVNVAFEGVDGEDLLMALDLEGISASSGSACTAGSLEPSHVILAMGYAEEGARQSVRFSFGPSTPTEALVDGARQIAEVAERLGLLEADW